LSIAVLRRQADGRWLMVIDDPYGDALLNQATSR
jgi:ketosteroid isomerase-like protein